MGSNHLGTAIRWRLEERGRLQCDLAKAVGISPSHLSRIIRGERFEALHMKEVLRMESFLGLKEGDLLRLHLVDIKEKIAEKKAAREQGAAKEAL